MIYKDYNQMIRKIMIITYAMLTAAISPIAFADSSTSKALLEKLYDIRQLVRAGINFNDYSTQVTELQLIAGRFYRDHGIDKNDMGIVLSKNREYSKTEISLTSAAENYFNALKTWRIIIEYGADSSYEKLQSQLNLAGRLISEIEQEENKNKNKRKYPKGPAN